MRTYFKTCYTKFKNLKNTDEFLGAYNMPQLNQDEINNLKYLQPVMILRELYKIYQWPKPQNQFDYWGNLPELKEKLTPILFKLFHELEWEGFQILFMKHYPNIKIG